MLDIPYSQRGIAGAGHRDRTIAQYLDAPDRGRVTTKDIDAISMKWTDYEMKSRVGDSCCSPCVDVPYSQYFVTSSTNN